MIRTWPGLLIAASFSALSVAADAQDGVAAPATGTDSATTSNAADPSGSDGGASSIAPATETAAPTHSLSTQADEAGVHDIIVTAQRRSENLTSVPLSISAETGKTLAATGIKDLGDIRFNTPGFISQVGQGYSQIYIRGIGNQVYIGADPSVTTFIDDVPRVYGALTEDLVNVDRVEILKGAQGGLYGRNATGGVVNIITRQPSDKFSAFARVTGGTYGTLQASAYVNVPLSDRIAWNISVTRNRHDPYRKNVAYFMPYTDPGSGPYNALARPGKVDNQDFWSFDSKVRVKLTDNFKITLAADYSDKNDATGNDALDLNPASTYATYVSLATGAGLTPVAPWPTLKLSSNKVYGAIPNKGGLKDYGASAKAELALDGLDITSITALRWSHTTFLGDIGAAPVPVAGFYTSFKRNFFYQELRAVSNNKGPFHYLAGATYFKDKIDGYIGGEQLGILFPPTASISRSESWSVYGQVSYDLTDKLTLMGSLRYVNERKTVTYPTPPLISATTAVHHLIPAATLSYKVDGGTLYARYANGFKTGGPNPLIRPDQLPANSIGLVIKPETVDTFEVGYRAKLFDNKLQLTSAIFYNNFKNIQATTTGNTSHPELPTATINFASARTYGAELSADWRASPALTVSANIGYLNAKYQNASFAGNAFLVPVAASGDRMRLAPKLQGGVQIAYDQPINDKLRLQANILYSYISSFYFTSDEDKTLAQKGYSQVNTRIGVVTMNDRLGVYLFADNLFDKRFLTFATNSGPFDFGLPGRPRVIGGTVELKY